MKDEWEAGAVLALTVACVVFGLLALAGLVMAVRALATWFSSGQWRRDLWP